MQNLEPANLKTIPPVERAGLPRVTFVCVLLILAVLAVFGQTAGFGFVNYDDMAYVGDNAIVQQGFTGKGFLWAWQYGEIGHWHPLTWLTHMADCQLYGLWAGGHHLTNVALHAAAAVFFFLALRSMTGALWRSAFVALVFAIHPLRAESVAWISERKDVLSGMFFMLTLWAYAHYTRRPSRSRYAAIMLCYGLGLLSKNMLVTTPCVLLLLDFWPLERLQVNGIRKMVVEKIPLFLLSAASCVATALVPEKIGTIGRIALPLRLENALVSYVIYIQKMLFPAKLAVPYLFSPDDTRFWKVTMAAVLLTGISAWAVLSWRKSPYLMVGWFWYLGMLLPAIGIVQISYYARADRYTYLPEIGLALAGTWAVAEWSVHWKYRQEILGGLMAAAAGLLMIGARAQTAYWRSSESLWNHVVACLPNNCVARDCLGVALASNGDPDGAIREYKKALQIKPDYTDAFSNLGLALYAKHQVDAAIAQYRKALSITPSFADAHNNLGVALFDKGDTDGAIDQYRQFLKARPDDAKTRSNLGLALFKKGEKEQAIHEFRTALESDPHCEKAAYNLGYVLANEGQTDEGIIYFRRALEIKPDYSFAYSGLGNALYAKGRWEEALAAYRKALNTDPTLGEARRGLGLCLLRTGDPDGAMKFLGTGQTATGDAAAPWISVGDSLLRQGDLSAAVLCYKNASQLNPSSAEAWSSLGLAFFQEGNLKEAAQHWRESVRLQPDQPDVKNNLAWLLATTPDASVRDGATAVALAEQARQLSGGTKPAVWRTLAAAYAETGHFTEAASAARQAVALARAQKNGNLVETLQREIKLYEAGQPVRAGSN